MNKATEKPMTPEQLLSETAHRIGEALGKELAGRFNVLGNISKDEATGLPTRTIKLVDRWGDHSALIEIRQWDGRSGD
jgi:hypothetical protein